MDLVNGIIQSRGAVKLELADNTWRYSYTQHSEAPCRASIKGSRREIYC